MPGELHQRLINYYLSCLARTSRPENSLFAFSKFDYDYVHLEGNPFIESTKVRNFDALQKIVRSPKFAEKQLYVGHVIRVRHVTSAKWEGFMLDPLLVAPVDLAAPNINATDVPAFINPTAIQYLTGIRGHELMDEVLAVEEEIGLANSLTDGIDMQQVVSNLQARFAEWIKDVPALQMRATSDIEETIPETVPFHFSNVNEEGLYPVSIIFAAERAKFTAGLESELKMLASMTREQIAGTALETLVYGSSNQEDAEVEESILAPVPLNSEQREAVLKSLEKKITVITGPPGTGKSQVVTCILVNSAFTEKSVLFSSKNNKAVDVVETRVNSLGNRPLLLRLGSKDTQGRLAEYLNRLTTASPDKNALEKFETNRRTYLHAQSNEVELKQQIHHHVEKRDAIELLDSEIQTFQQTSHLDLSELVSQVDSMQLQSELKRLRSLSREASTPLGLFGRIFSPNKRQKQAAELSNSIEKLSEEFLHSTEQTSKSTSFSTLEEWEELHDLLLKSLEYAKLKNLFKTEVDLQDLIRQLAEAQSTCSRHSQKLWESWLVTMPSRMSQDERKELSSYQATVDMLAKSSDSKSANKLRAQQSKMFPVVSKFLPCWAVTSLSIRNRVPLSPGYFELVVIDEASQCDIASAIPLLFRAKKAVVIGDPLQLRHVSNLDAATDRILLEQNDLLDELRWAYSTKSLFDIAAVTADQEALVSLRDHHRSDSDIIQFSNDFFYDGRLRVATRHSNLNKPNPKEAAVRWVSVVGESFRPSSGSLACRAEAEAIVSEIQRLSEQGYSGSLGVVTPFAAQSRLINDLVSRDKSLTTFLRANDFMCSTAHGFQGDERDVILMSPVIQKGATQSSISFVSSQQNLFNVAITRARASLVVFGDSSSKELLRVDHIRQFLDYLEKIHSSEKKTASSIEDFGPLYPERFKSEVVSDYEVRLYEELYKEGIKCVPQFKEDQYKLDLALFDGKRKLDIEVDGESHHRSISGELLRRDILRSQRLIELGWDVQRFWVFQVRDEINECVVQVKQWLSAR